MRKTVQKFTIAALLLLPMGCATGGEAEPTVTVTAEAPTTSDAAPTPTDTSAASETPSETAAPSPTDSSTAPAPAADTLSFDGLGEFSIGDTDLVDKGVVELEPECGVYVSTQQYRERGIYFSLDATSEDDPTGPLSEISVRAPEIDGLPVDTDRGVGPGVTFGEVRAAYPEAVEETKQGSGGPFRALVATEGDLELVFLNDAFVDADISDDQLVASMALREPSEEMRGTC